MKTIVNNRNNLFIVAESMFFVAFVTLVSSSIFNKATLENSNINLFKIIAVIIFLGFSFTLSWGYISSRAYLSGHYIVGKFKQAVPEYSEIEKKRIYPPTNFVLGVYLPLLTLIAWILLALSGKNNFIKAWDNKDLIFITFLLFGLILILVLFARYLIVIKEIIYLELESHLCKMNSEKSRSNVREALSNFYYISGVLLISFGLFLLYKFPSKIQEAFYIKSIYFEVSVIILVSLILSVTTVIIIWLEWSESKQRKDRRRRSG